MDGTVIICERQTDGIGRAGKRWISPTGGIWMSVILKPNVPSSQSLLIMFLATLTVCEVIKSETGLNPKIKWPNDVIISGKKVCGTLVNLGVVDNTICYAVIGIGINANNAITRIVSKLVACQTNTFHGITSLKAELDGSDVSAVDLIVSLIEKLEFYYDLLQQGLHDDILAKWKDMSKTLNKPILIREQDKVFEAIAEDIDLTGAITVKTADGNKRKIFSPDNIAWLNNNNNNY